jgi:hypothetical protein
LKKQEKISFVIGNGTSRKDINLTALKDHGTTYGCNALYRDFAPDHLVCVDVKMINEIARSGYNKTNTVWTNYNGYTQSIENFSLLNPSLGWSSGPTALHVASTHNPTMIYILGFDYQGLENNSFNNMYADTENYKKSNDRATFHGNWANQTATTIKRNPKIKYIRVVKDENFYTPEVIKPLPNLLNITVEKFKVAFKC